MSALAKQLGGQSQAKCFAKGGVVKGQKQPMKPAFPSVPQKKAGCKCK